MSKGALLFPLLLFYSCVTSAQDSDFNVSWGDTYSRTATQDAHFLYMGTWGGETYIRTGNDREQFLHRLSHRLRVVQTIALDQEFRGHSMYFERLIETPAGIFGYWKVPDRDSTQLLVVMAPFSHGRFGDYRVVFQHDFMKFSLASYRYTYSFLRRDWSTWRYIPDLIKASPDGLKWVYSNVERPVGFPSSNYADHRIAVFDQSFNLQEQMEVQQFDQERGRIKDVFVTNDGEVYAIRQLRKFNGGYWKAFLVGSHNPKDHHRLVRISPGSGEEVLPLELGNGRVPTSIDLIWNPTQQQYHVVGLFTDGTEPSNLGGFYTAILKAGTVSQAQTMAFSDEFRSQEIAHLDKLKDDLRSKVVSKPINTGKRLGEDYRVKASKFDSNGNLSCWLERHTTRKYTDTVEPEKDGASLFVRMDSSVKPINARIFSRFFVAQGNRFPTSLRWYEGEDLHVIYPNITTVEAQQESGGRSKGGGTLEYLVLGPDGETLRSEILMSGLSSFYDFNFPLARYESCVLFGELSPSKYKLGCTDEWE
ncbi:MAG: hypothetical protein AAFO03_05590 [Bacteroidota bacterium]